MEAAQTRLFLKLMPTKFISDKFYNSTKDEAMKYYLEFVDKDANNEPFEIPEYEF